MIRAMKTPEKPSLFATLALRAGQVWAHEGHPSLHLRCVTGQLWLSADGVDRVLRPGDTWQAARRGKVVVEALVPSRAAVLIGAPANDERIEQPGTPPAAAGR